MDLQEPLVHLFSAQGLQVGGIYPFRIGQNIDPLKIKESIKNSTIFCLNFTDRETFINYKRDMYAAEQIWSDPAQVLFFETKLNTCTLSTGRKLEAIPFQAHLTIYFSGFATIIFWIILSNDRFQGDEIIELTALARGTHERINRMQEVDIDLRLGDQVINVKNFVEICEKLEKEFLRTALKNRVSILPDESGGQGMLSLPGRGASSLSLSPQITLNDGEQKNNADKTAIRFVYPMVYVQEIPDCKTATDIIERHGVTIAGLANLWVRISSYLKQEEVKRTLENDFHPFIFGVNVISICCHLELHPKRDEAYLKKEGLDFDQNLQEERTRLSLLSEVPVIQFFILRIYDAELSKMLDKYVRPTRLRLINPLYPFVLVYNAIRLTGLQRQLVNQFRGVYLTRRSYLQRAISAHRDAFGTSGVEESIDKKLLALQNYVSTVYSMLTTIFILILSVLAVIFGIIQVIVALQGPH